MRKTIFIVTPVVIIGTTLAVMLGDPGPGSDEARTLAEAFHRAAGRGATGDILPLVGYPFVFDGQATIRDESGLRALLRRKKSALVSTARAAARLEIVTHRELMDGAPIGGRSFEPERAEVEAKKVGLREGGILVRFYREAEDRFYVLVMHEDDLGDLKITGYYD